MRHARRQLDVLKAQVVDLRMFQVNLGLGVLQLDIQLALEQHVAPELIQDQRSEDCSEVVAERALGKARVRDRAG